MAAIVAVGGALLGWLAGCGRAPAAECESTTGRSREGLARSGAVDNDVVAAEAPLVPRMWLKSGGGR